MKLFGGKASHRSKTGKKQSRRPDPDDFEVYTPYSDDPAYDVMRDRDGFADPKTGKNGKKKGKGDKKGKLLLVVAIIAFVLAGTAFALTHFIRPPDISGSKNDATIVDPENGDAVTIDQGQRISDYFTFLVCATDIEETRTDNIMLVGFDTKNHKVNVLNIPRDIMCSNNRKGASKKINAAYGQKHDIENTMREVKKVIGFTPDKYIVMNFNGIAEIADAIGGVDYEIPFKMIYNDPVQDLHIYFEPGAQHLNGKQVVEFLRWRHNDPGYTHLQTKGYDGGDESRIKKQQEFLRYLAGQILKPANILKAKPIAQAVFNNVRTDLTMGELVWMANQAMQVKNEDIQMFTVPGYAASSYAGTNAFLSFYFPNESETLKLINQYFNPFDKEITSLDVISSPPDGTRRTEPSPEDDPDVTDDEPADSGTNEEDPEPSDGGAVNPETENGGGEANDDPMDFELPDDPGGESIEPTPEPEPEPEPAPEPEPPAEDLIVPGLVDPEA